MEQGELNNYLTFVRKGIGELETQLKIMDRGDWGRNVRGDFDKEMIYSDFQNILSRFKSLLRRDYDCEKRKEFHTFGKTVPQEFINNLLTDGVAEEEITTEYLETLLEYQRRDVQ